MIKKSLDSGLYRLSAQQLVDALRTDAEARALKRAVQFEEIGEFAGANRWRNILRAVRQILRSR